jgi:hypothetical protein
MLCIPLDDQQKKKKLSYLGNFVVTAIDSSVVKGHATKDGYIKAEQFYYFNKSKTNYHVIARLTEETFAKLIQFISKLDEYEHIIDNLE